MQPTLDSAEKANNQKYNNWLYWIASVVIASTVALGEALVALYFMNLATVSAMISIGLPAFIVNFLLFRLDTETFFKNWANPESDKTTNSINKVQRYILVLSRALAIFAGICCGFLQLNSILITFGHLIWGLSAVASITAPPIGLILVAAVVATVAAIANMALLYANVEKFVTSDYKEYVKVYRKIFSSPKNLADKLSLGWKIYYGIFIGVAILSAVAIYFVSLGLYKAQAFQVFNKLCGLSVSVSLIVSNIVVHPGQLLNGFFYSRNMANAVLFMGNSIKAIYDRLKQIYHSDKSLYKEFRSVVKEVGAKTLALVLAGSGFLFYCCAVNGVTQGQGAFNEPRSINFLRVLYVPEWFAKQAAYIWMSVSSTFANAYACYEDVISSYITKPKEESSTATESTVNATDITLLELQSQNSDLLNTTTSVKDTVRYSLPTGATILVANGAQDINPEKPSFDQAYISAPG